jgi:hypothetical protein
MFTVQRKTSVRGSEEALITSEHYHYSKALKWNNPNTTTNTVNSSPEEYGLLLNPGNQILLLRNKRSEES